MELHANLKPDIPVGDHDAIAFAIKLGSALHRYGTPAHRLEEAMGMVLGKLGLEGQFFATPTGIFASFGGPEAMRTSLIRVEPGSVNLGKLSLLDELSSKVILGELAPVEGSTQVDEIVAAPSAYGSTLTALCFGLASGAAARFIG